VNFFLSKRIMTRAEFDRLAAAARVRAFTAAYVHAADQLQTVYNACLAAIAKGQTLTDFVKQTENILTRPWHRETVFRTNVLSAYGRGHWEQAQAARAMRPYARYSAVMDGRTRPSHTRLHGLIYPLEHEFWKTYWPPWDYNCRCGAFTLSQSEIDTQGLKVSRELPQGVGPRNNFVSPARGEEWQPDLGKYDVGIKQAALEKLAAKVFEEPQFAAMLKRQLRPEDLASWEGVLWSRERGGIGGYRNWVVEVVNRGHAQGEIFPVGNLPPQVLDFLKNQGIKPRLALTAIDDQAVLHMQRDVKQTAGAALTVAEIAAIPEKFATAEWYWDRKDPALLMTWIRAGDSWIKVVIRLDQKIGKGMANRVVSAGLVKRPDIQGGDRYEKI
jgi:SPP1 gp7 family putative phage head morphogenesis protein